MTEMNSSLLIFVLKSLYSSKLISSFSSNTWERNWFKSF